MISPIMIRAIGKTKGIATFQSRPNIPFSRGAR